MWAYESNGDGKNEKEKFALDERRGKPWLWVRLGSECGSLEGDRMVKASDSDFLGFF